MGANTNAALFSRSAGKSTGFLSVNKYQKRPELLLAVDKLSAPSRLTLFTPVPWDYFSEVKLPANKPTSRKPTSQALLSRRNPGARDKK